jgi:galactosylceramide sulfotransferase
MLWDLGMDVKLQEDQSELRKEIEYLENQFDLVMISERFDESLIVLKEKLCWDLEDVIYLNVRRVRRFLLQSGQLSCVTIFFWC